MSNRIQEDFNNYKERLNNLKNVAGCVAKLIYSQAQII